MTTSLAAVVLTGGQGRRLGGHSKGDLLLDGVRLLDRAVAACADCSEVVVVGDPPAAGLSVGPAGRAPRFLREEPRHSGPASALLTGLAALDQRDPVDLVAVLAVDMPLLTTATVARLRAAAETPPVGDGAVLVDAGGRAHLALVVRPDALARVAPPREEWPGLAMRALTGALDLRPVVARGDEESDVDTWADAERLRVTPD